jgi:glycosyltransferase involved in cell wall biosynthesis
MNPVKILIITIGQPSTNPRMVKEYIALKDAGYHVKVLYAHWANWAVKTDSDLFEHSSAIDKNDFFLVGGTPVNQKVTYFVSRLVFKVADLLMLKAGFGFLDKWALNRPCFFLSLAANREKADVYIAHNLGALPAACDAATKAGKPVIFDAEDFHRGDLTDTNGKQYQLIKNIEDKYIPKCNYLTAASPLIAREYQNLYSGKKVAVINNVFSIKHVQPVKLSSSESPLRLFWFSQTIGPNRGLEAIINVVNKLSPDYNITLTLLGDVAPEYERELRANCKSDFLFIYKPVSPDELFSVAANFDIGMAVEVAHNKNRDICLTNKLFSYLLAGLCIVASDTSAQKQFMNENPEVGYIFCNDRTDELEEILKKLYFNRDILNAKKQAAIKLASSKFNWEIEKKTFLQHIDNILSSHN